MHIAHLKQVYNCGSIILELKGVGFLSLRYKIDVVAALKEAGYTTYRLRNEKLIGEATMTKLRKGELVSWNNIDTICGLLNCHPGDLVEHY